MHAKLFGFYLSVETAFRKDAHPAMPFFDFFQQVATQREDGASSVYNTDVLNALSYMYSRGFLSSMVLVNGNHKGQGCLDTTLLATCGKLIASMPDKKHAIQNLWPRWMLVPLTTGGVCAIRRRRRDAWKDRHISDDETLVERINFIKRTMSSLCSIDELSRSSTIVLDVYADLVELSRYVHTSLYKW
jgi:hypothetical protein